MMGNSYDRQKTRRAPIIITNILRSGAAFATCLDTGGRVFIPTAVIESVSGAIGVEYEANLIENRFRDENVIEDVPHMAVFIFPRGGRIEMIEQLLRRVEEGETTARDAKILRTLLQDARMLPRD